MTNTTETFRKLESMSNDKLMDVLRNGKFYGYSVEIERHAAKILESRDIQESEISMGATDRSAQKLGAVEIKKSYSQLSIVALVAYTIIIILSFLDSFAEQNPLLFIGIYLISFLTFIGCLIGSVVRLTQFFKAVNKPDSTAEVLLYVLLGLPLYLIVYLYFLQRMNSLLKHQS